MVDTTIIGAHGSQPGVAPVYTERQQGAGYYPGNVHRATVAELRSGVVAQADTYLVPIAGALVPFSWSPLSTATDDGTTCIAVTGITTGRYLVDGTLTVNSTPVTGIATDESITATIVDGVATLSTAVPPTASDTALGAQLLSSALVWGSSLAVTKSALFGGVLPDSFFTDGTLIGVTITTGLVGSASNRTALAIVLNSETSEHYFAYNLYYAYGASCPATGGARTRCTFRFLATGACASTTAFYVWLNGSNIQLLFDTASPYMNVGGAEAAGVEKARFWKRADGWTYVEVIYAHTSNQIYIKPLGNGSYAGDGTSSIVVDALTFSQDYVASVTNKATGSGATITSVAGPELDTTDCPEEGWIDGTPSMLWREHAATLSVSTIHSTISGQDTGFAATFLWEPYSEVSSDSAILTFAGATASLVLSETTDSKIKLTRTNNDGTSASVTFSRYVGLTAQVMTLQLYGGLASLWIQDRLVDVRNFLSDKACTFTSTTIGSATLRARVAEFAIFSSATPLQSWDIKAIHEVIALRRGLSIDPVKVWFHGGQSNCMPNGISSQLTAWAPPVSGAAIHYESASSTHKDSGWGRCRWCAPSGHRKSKFSAYAGHTETASGTYGSELMFSAGMGRVATMRFAVGGSSVGTFLPGGANYTAMIAAFDDAFAKIGIPYEIEGFLIDWGEEDCGGLTSCAIFASLVEQYCGVLATRYGASDYKVIMTEIHASYGAPALNLSTMRANEEAWQLATPTTRGLTNIDDQALSFDNVHRLSPNTQLTAGARMATKAQSLRATLRQQ